MPNGSDVDRAQGFGINSYEFLIEINSLPRSRPAVLELIVHRIVAIC